MIVIEDNKNQKMVIEIDFNEISSLNTPSCEKLKQFKEDMWYFFIKVAKQRINMAGIRKHYEIINRKKEK